MKHALYHKKKWFTHHIVNHVGLETEHIKRFKSETH